MTNDLVSIVMPTYNSAQYIGQAIESVQKQSYTNWELLIVDDGSTDNTKTVVQSFAEEDSRIHYLYQINAGAAVARNKALQMAKGRYIAFLDSDDIWLPLKLEHQLRFMQANDYAFTYTKFHRVDIDLRQLPIVVSGPNHISKLGMYAFCWPSCPTVIYDVQRIGLIQIEPIRKHNDYAMWLKIIDKADCYLLDEDLFAYRKHEGSISSVSYASLITYHYKLWREVMQYSVFGALFWTGINIVCGIYKKIKYVKTI